jgi:hypothetical protein
MSKMACSRQFDCGLRISTRWISRAIADFVFAFLSCVLVCESSARAAAALATKFAQRRSM